jgi:hypothetical protein
MSDFTIYGLVCELKPSVKGYTRLTVATNTPFRTKLMKFNVWNNNLLQKETLEPFKAGDEVKVIYNYKNTFPSLITMTQSPVDNCPVCYASLEAINAQRLECTGCSLIPPEDRKIRLNMKMMLRSRESKQYMYSTGQRLDLFDEDQRKSYIAVVFENNFVYKSIKDMKAGHNYYIVGWVSRNGNLIDIVDIY